LLSTFQETLVVLQCEITFLTVQPCMFFFFSHAHVEDKDHPLMSSAFMRVFSPFLPSLNFEETLLCVLIVYTILRLYVFVDHELEASLRVVTNGTSGYFVSVPYHHASSFASRFQHKRTLLTSDVIVQHFYIGFHELSYRAQDLNDRK